MTLVIAAPSPALANPADRVRATPPRDRPTGVEVPRAGSPFPATAAGQQRTEELAGDWRRLDQRIDGLSGEIEAPVVKIRYVRA
jgi:hypothetical protein